MQSVLIWADAVPLSGCWVPWDGSSLCPFHHSSPGCCWEEQRNSAWPVGFLILGLLGLYSPEIWDSPCMLSVTENSEFQPKWYMGIILTLRGFSSPFDFHSSATHIQTFSVATHRAQHLAGLSPSLILLNPTLLTFKATHQGFLSTFPEQAACLSWAFLH